MYQPDSESKSKSCSVHRITSYVYTAAIEAAYSLIPPVVTRLLTTDFLTGSDPIFAGLHNYKTSPYGRSYRDHAHVVYPFHQWGLHKRNRTTTIVLPIPKSANVKTIIHELGHVLDERLGFRHDAVPVSSYAETDRNEAFAESFTSWIIRGYSNEPVDKATLALFEHLMQGEI